ncbi:MAG TPA: hypothetical protein VKK31_22200 [Thermoanaerobaculia bacterium]|nr:hypothetical protein [Thermoanaerobaculia bacterium]
MERFEDIQQKIADIQKLRDEYESVLVTTDRPEERMRAERQIEIAKRLLSQFLEAFLRMCTRLGRPVPESVRELAAELLGEAAPGPAPEPEAPPEVPSTRSSSVLPGVQAAASIRSHLQSQPVRLLNVFARDVWVYSSPIQPALLRQRLQELEAWYSQAGGLEPAKEISDLHATVQSLRAVEPLFPYPDVAQGLRRAVAAL